MFSNVENYAFLQFGEKWRQVQPPLPVGCLVGGGGGVALFSLIFAMNFCEHSSVCEQKLLITNSRDQGSSPILFESHWSAQRYLGRDILNKNMDDFV